MLGEKLNNMAKLKTQKPLVIIDSLNGQYWFDSGKVSKDGKTRLMSKSVKVRGEKNLVKKAINVAITKGVDIFDRHTGSRINFSRWF